MRGKGWEMGLTTRRMGITPAYAGKSSLWTHQCAAVQDHPRLCGEKLYKALYKHVI